MNFREILVKKWGILLTVGLLFASISFVVFLATEKNFKSEIKFLIVQEQGGTQDYYSIAKSSEYIGKVLGEAVHSELFIDEVVKTGKVDEEFLPFDKKERLKEWARIVKISRNSQLGVIDINVFDNSSKYDLKITEAISEVLVTKNTLFHGGKENIDIRVLSGPILEKNPTVLEIVLVSFGGFLLGFLASFSFLIYKIEREKDDYEESLRFIEQR